MKVPFWKRRGARAAAAVVATGVLTSWATPRDAKACEGDGNVFIGSICMVSFGFCPNGYVEAAGGTLSISQNQALYSLLGTIYGGDGRATLGIPDLRGRLPIGEGQGPGMTDVPLGLQRGAENHVMTVDMLPEHTHEAITTVVPSVEPLTVKASQTLSTRSTPENGDLVGVVSHNLYSRKSATSPVNLGGITAPGAPSASVAVMNLNTGDGQPLATIDPSAAIRFCVATTGLYPPRP